jgi:zinc protease
MMRPAGCPGTSAAAQSPDAWDWPVLTVVRKTLANGLRVILAENHTVPLVWLSWVSQAGIEWDPPSLTGLAAMTPLLLREGTAHRSAGQMTGELDDLGADLVAGCDWQRAFLNLELLSCDLAAGAGLLLDMACFARFPDAAVSLLRQRRVAELERRRRQPRALADDEFARALYGDTTYGRSPLGTPATLQRIEAADVERFYESHYRPASSCLVLTGSFESEAAADLLGLFELPAAPLAGKPLPLPFAAAEPAAGIRVVDIPQAAQTELRVGHAGVERASGDLAPLQVLNAVLGEGPSSRLAQSLRQGQGLTYHIRSRFAARHGGGPFVVATSVAGDAAGAALAGIVHEIERLCTEPVPVAELEQTKRRLLGADLRRFQSILGVGSALSQAAFDGDPAQDFECRRREIAAIEPDGLLELARRHLHPERLIAVAAGPAAALQSQLSDEGAHGWQFVSRPIEFVGGMA